MKIEVTGGDRYSLNLKAEHQEENVVLLKLAIELNEQATAKGKHAHAHDDDEGTHRTYKKQRATRCPDCGKKVKGAIGLGLHRAKSNCSSKETKPCPHCGQECRPAGLNIHIAKKHPTVVRHAEAEVKPKTNFLGENFGKMKSEVIV
jgi:hypothetical protein